MAGQERPLQRLLALDKFGDSLDERIHEAARIIRLDIGPSSSGGPAYRKELHEWVLKWIVEKLRNDAESSRTKHLSWQLTRLILTGLPSEVATRVLRQGQFVDSISSALEQIPIPVTDVRPSKSSLADGEADEPKKLSKKRKRTAPEADSDGLAAFDPGAIFHELVGIARHLLHKDDTASRQIFTMPSKDLHTLISRWLRAVSWVVDHYNPSALGAEQLLIIVEQSVTLVRKLWKRPYPLWSDPEQHKQAIGAFGWDLLDLSANLSGKLAKSGESASVAQASNIIGKVLLDMLDKDVLEPIFSAFMITASRSTGASEMTAADGLEIQFRSVRTAFIRHIEQLESTGRSLASQGAEQGFCYMLTLIMRLCLNRITASQLRLRRLQAQFCENVFLAFLTGEDNLAMVQLESRKALLAGQLAAFCNHRESLGAEVLTKVLQSYHILDPFESQDAKQACISAGSHNFAILAHILNIAPGIFQIKEIETSPEPSAFLRLLTRASNQDIEANNCQAIRHWVKSLVLPYIEAQSRTRDSKSFFTAFAETNEEIGAFRNGHSIWDQNEVRAALSSLLRRTMNTSGIEAMLVTLDLRAGEHLSRQQSDTDAKAQALDRHYHIMALMVDIVRSDDNTAALRDCWQALLVSNSDKYPQLAAAGTNRCDYLRLLISLHDRLSSPQDDSLGPVIRWQDELIRREAAVISDALSILNPRESERREGPRIAQEVEAALRYVLHLNRATKGTNVAHTQPVSLIYPTIFEPLEALEDAATTYQNLVFRDSPLLAKVLLEFPSIFVSLGRDSKVKLLTVLFEASSTNADLELLSQAFELANQGDGLSAATGLKHQLMTRIKQLSAEQQIWLLSSLDLTSKATKKKMAEVLDAILVTIDTRGTNKAVLQADAVVSRVQCSLRAIARLAEHRSAVNDHAEAFMQCLEKVAQQVDGISSTIDSCHLDQALAITTESVLRRLSDDVGNKVMDRKSIRKFRSSKWQLADGAVQMGSLMFAIPVLSQARKIEGLKEDVKLITNIARGLEIMSSSKQITEQRRDCAFALAWSFLPDSIWELGGASALETFRSAKRNCPHLESMYTPPTIDNEDATAPPRESRAVFGQDLHPQVRQFLENLYALDLEYRTLASQIDNLTDLLSLYEKRRNLICLVEVRQALVAFPRKEAIDDTFNRPAKRLLIRLALLLQTASDSQSCYALLQCVQIILKDKRNLVSQPGIEETLNALLSLLHSSHPLKSPSSFSTLYLSLCTTLQLILQHHRSTLRGRHHLLTPLLTRLLSLLSTPHGPRQSRSAFDLPHWHNATHPLGPNHAAHFARCVTLLCNPPPSTVRRRRSSGPELVDPVREARIQEADHVPRLLSAYCNFQLHGRMGEGVKEKLSPAVYAIFDVMYLADPDGDDRRVRVLGASMGREGLALLRREYGEWKRFGRWKG